MTQAHYINLLDIYIYPDRIIEIVIPIIGILILMGIFIFLVKFYEKKEKKEEELLEKDYWINNILKSSWFLDLKFPIIFVVVEKQEDDNYDTIAWVYENIWDYSYDLVRYELLKKNTSNKEILPDFFLDDFKNLEKNYIIDSNYDKYKLSYKWLEKFWPYNDKYKNLAIPILSKDKETLSFDVLESLFLGAELWTCFNGDEIEDYKIQNLPKTFDTLIKIVNYDF